MRIQNDTIYVDPTIEQTDLKELHQFLLENCKNMERVRLDNQLPIATSGFISLIISLKNGDASLDVDFLDKNKEISLSGIGDLEIKY